MSENDLEKNAGLYAGSGEKGSVFQAGADFLPPKTVHSPHETVSPHDPHDGSPGEVFSSCEALSSEEIFSSAPVGIIVTTHDENAEILMANEAAGSVFGIIPDALLGQKITVLAGDGKIEELLVESAASQKSIADEIALGDAGLPQRHVHVTLTHGKWQGQTARFWWLNDVTEIRRTESEWRQRERQLHAVIDAAEDAVFEFSLQTGGASVSPRFWQFLGMSLEEAISRQNTSSETIYHNVREDYQLSFASSLRVPQQDEPYEWTGPFRKNNGEDVWLYMRGRVTGATTDNPKIIGVATNISAQKAVEESLIQAKEYAEQANMAKSAFLATMSHEIRTPMTAILGSLEYLLGTPLVKEQHRMVSIARESGVSLLAILNDILDLSKIEAGKLTLEETAVSPRTVIQGACDAALIVARQKGIYLRCRFVSELPALILSDPTRLRQILMNLINNAVKFTERGGVTIGAEVSDLGGGQGVLRVTVHDTGVGLTEEQRQKIFRPFTQADDSTTRKFGGTGLGLSICQRLVERMGGEIGVYSKAGQGASFWFHVRIGMTDQKPDALHSVHLDGMRILLVDPEAESGRQTREILEDVGGSVTVVRSGREALIELMRGGYVLVLLEQALPDAKGLDRAVAMRTLAPTVHITLYTSEDQDTIGWAAQDAGVFYMPRSTPYQQFLDTIHSFAKGSQTVAKATPNGISPMNGRVLIAEDTASVRQILEVQVRGMGVDVDFVENGRIALEKMQRGHYALVISDLHMPEVDGYGLVHEWREREAKRGRGEHLPIVALTADVLIGDKSRFISEGFDDYVAKPVSRNTLRDLIFRWLKTISAKEDGEEGTEPSKNNDEPHGDRQQETGEKSGDSKSGDAEGEYGGVKAEKLSCSPSSAADSPIVHDRLVEILGLDDEELIRDSLALFVETARETFAALEQAYAGGDLAGSKGPAHSLKGSARMAGAIKLGDIAAELDLAAKAGRFDEGQLAACRDELKRVLDHIFAVYVPREDIG